MRFARRGVAGTVVAALIVVVVVVGAGAYFVILSPKSTGGNTSSGPPTTSVPSATASSGTTAAISSAYTGSTNTQSTSYATSATSCSSTTTSTSGSSSSELNFSAYFAAYSEMSVEFNGTYNGAAASLTGGYNVLYASSTTYKVNITENASGSTATYTAWVQKNGTAVAVYFAGQNYTGFYATSFFLSAMGAITIETTFTTPEFLSAATDPAFSTQTSQSTVTLGPTSVTVTDFVAKNLPLTIDQCGFNAYFTRFSIQTGAVSGESLPLLTALDLAGNLTSNGTSQNVDLTFHITSLTKAA